MHNRPILHLPKKNKTQKEQRQNDSKNTGPYRRGRYLRRRR